LSCLIKWIEIKINLYNLIHISRHDQTQHRNSQITSPSEGSFGCCCTSLSHVFCFAEESNIDLSLFHLHYYSFFLLWCLNSENMKCSKKKNVGKHGCTLATSWHILKDWTEETMWSPLRSVCWWNMLNVLRPNYFSITNFK
jgi:hypothetical protein